MTTLEKLTIGVVVVAGIKLAASGVVLALGDGRTVTLGLVDAGATAALLGPVLAAYAASLHASFRDENKNGIDDAQEKKA